MKHPDIQALFKKDYELKEIFRKALLEGYVSGDTHRHGDGTKFSEYQSGDWYVAEYWLGGNPFSGIVEIRYQETICWSMIYRGKTSKSRRKETKAFLKEALSQPNSAFAVRGPNYYGVDSGGDAMRYLCDNHAGGIFDIGDFVIQDKIFSLDGKMLYQGEFKGGWTNVD